MHSLFANTFLPFLLMITRKQSERTKLENRPWGGLAERLLSHPSLTFDVVQESFSSNKPNSFSRNLVSIKNPLRSKHKVVVLESVCTLLSLLRLIPEIRVSWRIYFISSSFSVPGGILTQTPREERTGPFTQELQIQDCRKNAINSQKIVYNSSVLLELVIFFYFSEVVFK